MSAPRSIALVGFGCLATGAQVHLVREFMALFAGNELGLAVVFACWFAGVVTGAALAGRLADRARSAWTWFGACGVALPVALFSAVLLVRTWRPLVGVPVGQLPSIGLLLASGLAIVTPLALLIGLAFPFACRALVDTTASDLSVGRTYVLESGGAVAGGLLVGVVLPGWLSPFWSMAALSLPLLLGIAWASRRTERRLAGLGAAAGLILIGLAATGLLSGADRASAGWRFASLETGGERVASADTAYQHLDLAERAGQHNLYADGKLMASFPDPYTARPRAHLVLCQHRAPARVLLLGPAFTGFVPAALRHPIARLDAVELDPGIGDLVEPFLAAGDRTALANARVARHATDGRRFLQRSDERWDLIFSDSPDPVTANLNRFYTREFFELVRAHLADGGVFAGRISSGVNLLGQDTATRVATLRRTLEAVFDHVRVVPGQETFLFASTRPGQLLTDPDALARRYRARGVDDPRFSADQFSLLVQADLVRDLADQLAALPAGPINTDDRPITTLQSALRWSRMTGDPAGVPLRWLMTLPAWAWLLVFAGLLSPFAVGALRPGAQPALASWRAAGLAIFTVGALGMTLELVLSFAYQSLAGSLYQELGLIVAAFMAGLVAGGVLIQRRLARRPAGPVGLGWLLFGLAAFSAALPWLQAAAVLEALPMALAQAWLLLLVLTAGVGTGLVFPMAGQVAVRRGRPVGRAAGGLDAWDHLGAALGALLAGVVLVPALGRASTCLVLAGLCALAGLVNLLVSRRERASRPRAREEGDR